MFLFSQVPVKPAKTADNDTSLSDTTELAPAVSDKLTVAEKVDKFSALSASSVASGSTASSRSTIALETGGIHVQSFVASLQPNLSHNKSSSSVDKSLLASKCDAVSTPPKPAKKSVSLGNPVVTTSSVSPAPPPLPCRPSSTSLSNRSDSSVQSVTKQFRPPPPIPGEPAASISSHRESLSPHLPFTTSRSGSPTARKSVPVIRYL